MAWEVNSDAPPTLQHIATVIPELAAAPSAPGFSSARGGFAIVTRVKHSHYILSACGNFAEGNVPLQLQNYAYKILDL